MKIALSGYGKMGREIEKTALEKGHEILFRLDNERDWANAGPALRQAEVVIDFSEPATAVPNIRRCFNLNLPVVTGTTGWYDDLEKVKNWCSKENQAIVVASNFSIGVNILFGLTRKLGQLAGRFGDYRPSLEEVHHVHKIDAPSGTAIQLARIILESTPGLKEWVNEKTDDPEMLGIVSRREGEETGTHIIRFTSSSDEIQLVHKALDRKGFAIGAILAAQWIKGKKGFFQMKDVLELS